MPSSPRQPPGVMYRLALWWRRQIHRVFSARERPVESNFLLEESSGTRIAPVEAERERGSERSLWVPRTPHFGPLLQWVEERRLLPILDGSDVRMIDTSDRPERALVHRHWIGLLGRLLGAIAALWAAIWFSPVLLSLLVLTAVHGLTIVVRRNMHRYVGYGIGAAEFLVGFVIHQWLGPGWLHAALIIGALTMVLLTVVAWQVDMELITSGGRLVRTRGLLLLKRTVSAPLTSIRIAEVTGPFRRLGFVTVDTTSDRDGLLHNFGLIAQPDEWVALLQREARERPREVCRIDQALLPNNN